MRGSRHRQQPMLSTLAVLLYIIHSAQAKIFQVEGFPHNISLNLRFAVNGGLSNQHYGILTGVALALEVQPDTLMFPPLLTRETFAVDDPGKTNFTTITPDSVYDMDAIRERLAQRGIELDTSGSTLDHIHRFYANYPKGQKIKEQQVELPFKALQQVALHEVDWRGAVAHHVRQHRDKLAATASDDGVVNLYLRTHSLLYAIDLTSTPLSVEASRLLRFAPRLRSLAAAAVARLEEVTDGPWFDGLHLRLEEDGKEWLEWFDGAEDGMWASYRDGLERLDVSRLPVYVASGIWSRYDVSDSSKKMQGKVDAFMRKQGLRYFYKEMILPATELDQLSSEQMAALDMLVLLRSRHFVGFDASTLSRAVREIRAVHGLPRDTSFLVTHGAIPPRQHWKATYTQQNSWKGSLLPVCFECRAAPEFPPEAAFPGEPAPFLLWDNFAAMAGPLIKPPSTSSASIAAVGVAAGGAHGGLPSGGAGAARSNLAQGQEQQQEPHQEQHAPKQQAESKPQQRQHQRPQRHQQQQEQQHQHQQQQQQQQQDEEREHATKPLSHLRS